MMRIPTVREPTQGQLLTMAYVDGKLTELSRRKLEDVLRRDPALMREATGHVHHYNPATGQFEELSHDDSAVSPIPLRQI